MADVFISYSRQDAGFVRRLHEALSGRGRDVWVDWEDIPPAFEWRDELHEGIDDAGAVIFVISPKSVDSRECAAELERAIEQGKRIVPVVHQDPDGESVPEALANRNWVFLRADDDFEAGVEKVVSALDTDPEWVRTHTRLLERAQEWEHGDRSPAMTLRGSDLQAAEAALAGWHEGTEPAPTASQREYVLASRRTASRRLRGLVALLAVALVISIALGVLALVQRGKAIDREHSAQSRQIAVAGLLQLDADPELATVLALEALRRDHTPEAEDALRRAVARVQTRGEVRAGKRPIEELEVSPDQSRYLVVGADGRIRIWALGRAKPEQELPAHRGGVSTARFDRDGRFVVTAGAKDGLIRIWDVRAKRLRKEIAGPRGDFDAWLSADDKRVIAADPAGNLEVLDARTGRRRGPQLINTGGSLTETVVDPNGRWVLADYRDGHVQGWDAVTGTRMGPPLRLPGESFGNAVAPNGRFAVTVGPGSAIRVWDPRTGRVIRRLRGHRGDPYSVAVSPDSRSIATGALDNTARVWDAGSGRVRQVLRGHGDTVQSVEFSRDSRRLLSSSPDETARVWSVRTGDQLSTLHGQFTTASLAPNGEFVVTGAKDGRVRTWEATPGRKLAYLTQRGHTLAAAFSGNGRVLAAAGSDDRVTLLDAATAKSLGVLDTSKLTSAAPLDLAFAPTGNRLALADGAGGVVIDTRTRKVGPIVEHDDYVNQVAWSGDGRRLATASDDGTAQVVDARTGRQLARVKGGHGAIDHVQLTPDGSRLITADNRGAVQAWRVTDSQRIGELPTGARINDIDLSKDGRRVAVAGGNSKVYIWRPGSGRPALERTHNAPVYAVEFNPDGDRVASASADGSARVWDARSGRSLAVLRGHLDVVNDVDFSRDGRFLVTASGDNTVRLWDARDFRGLGALGEFDSAAGTVRFSPRGHSILALPIRGRGVEYACDACAPMDELVVTAHRLVRRSLTAAERKRYLPS